ncbi:MAG: hypothetical protein J1F07_02590 [Muribaculaceae bacterium]|nr:hypothetical protein [Muribaculaceae bacterium]
MKSTFKFFVMGCAALVVVGLSACKDSGDEPEGAFRPVDGKVKPAIQWFGDAVFLGYGYEDLIVSYENSANTASKEFKITFQPYYRNGLEPLVIDFGGNTIWVGDTRSDTLNLTKEGYVAQTKFTFFNYSSGHTYGSGSVKIPTTEFAYNKKGHLTTISVNNYYSFSGTYSSSYMDENSEWITETTYEESHSLYDKTTTLTWQDGNLVRIEISETRTNLLKETDPELVYTASYDITYGNEQNPELQFPIALAKTIYPDNELQSLFLVGLLGHGPAKLPVKIEGTDRDGKKVMLALEFTMRDVNGKSVIASETIIDKLSDEPVTDWNTFGYYYQTPDCPNLKK